MPRTKPLLAGTVVPVVIGLAVFTGGGHAAAGTSVGETPTATPQHQGPGVLLFASCNPCGPCNPCRPCAGACGPCGPCNPCNPCAGACGACGPCNPCNPCNPCAGACGPCGACNRAIPVRLRSVRRLQPVCGRRCSRVRLRRSAPRGHVQSLQPLRSSVQSLQPLRCELQSLQPLQPLCSGQPV